MSASIEIRQFLGHVEPGAADGLVGTHVPVTVDGRAIGTGTITSVEVVDGFVHLTADVDNDVATLMQPSLDGLSMGPLSYPETITNPKPPPTVDGTTITRELG